MTPINIFLNGLAVVGVVLVAIVALRLPGMLADWLSWKRDVWEYKFREQEREHPYSRIELSQCPNQTMVGLDFYRGDKLVYSGSATLPSWLYRVTYTDTNRFTVSGSTLTVPYIMRCASRRAGGGR